MFEVYNVDTSISKRSWTEVYCKRYTGEMSMREIQEKLIIQRQSNIKLRTQNEGKQSQQRKLKMMSKQNTLYRKLKGQNE